MAGDENGSIAAATQQAEHPICSTGPGWSAPPFDVPCRRCGANLVGQPDGRCGDCSLEFDWADVLPLDRLRCLSCGYNLLGLTVRRCPECGKPFEWSDVLAGARSRASALFENQWVKNPLPSLGRTWLLAAFRPRGLWSLYSIHDPPRVVPLLLFAVVQWVIFAHSWRTLAPLADWCMRWLTETFVVNLRFTYTYRPGLDFMPHMALWWVATFVGLQFFAQSKRRFHVRWPHVLRVHVHATALAALLMLLWFLTEWIIDLSVLVVPALRGRMTLAMYNDVGKAIFVGGVAVTWARLWRGYRHHLNIPRGWGMAALALVLGHCMARLVEIYL